jgi:hypothetical protein
MTRAAIYTPPVAHPTDDVFVVIDNTERADATIRALRAAGFSEADIHVFRGREEIVVLARAWVRHLDGPAFLASILAAFLNAERNIEAIYESSGLAGCVVLAVHTRSLGDVDEATRVLRDSGAHDSWYFGSGTKAAPWPGGPEREAARGTSEEHDDRGEGPAYGSRAGARCP